jgi:hypothetical protein
MVFSSVLMSHIGDVNIIYPLEFVIQSNDASGVNLWEIHASAQPASGLNFAT